MDIQEFQKLSVQDRMAALDTMTDDERRSMGVKGALALLQQDVAKLVRYFEEHDPMQDQFLGVCAVATMLNDMTTQIVPPKS